MIPADHYLTLAAPAISDLRERASKFLGFAFPLTDQTDYQRYLDEVKALHPKATHHCYAYRFGPGEDQYRANDDGEPSGSAGKPILGQIDSFGLSNVLIIVVRYYGGTKLGVPGLIQAYREAAKLAIESAEIVQAYYTVRLKITAEYPTIPDVMHVGKQFDWSIIDQTYSPTHQSLVIDIREADYAAFFDALQVRAGGMYPDDLKEGKTSTTIHISNVEDHDQDRNHR